MEDEEPSKATIPDTLLSRDQWVCWRLQERNGAETKVPVNPHNGSFGSTTDPDSWADFDGAREYLRNGSADGLGFVFTGEDPLVGVDLDDCRVPETGTLTDAATAIVERLASYTEVSPSRTGVHVLLSGSLPGDRNREGWVEIYDDARFFTVTGQHVSGTPATVEQRNTELATVYAEHVESADQFPSSTETDRPSGDDDNTSSETKSDTSESADLTVDDPGNESAADSVGNSLSDDEILDRATGAANGEKFHRLWNGTTTGYESHSEADMALCALLAFWTGGDREQIDRLFRQSGLLREKWDDRHFADGSTYGEKTIERVIAGTDEFYKPRATAGSNAGRATDRSTAAADEPTADAVALRREIEDLRATRQTHLELIAELRDQVERLETEKRRLSEELDRLRTENPADGPDDQDSSSRLSRLSGWLSGRRV